MHHLFRLKRPLIILNSHIGHLACTHISIPRPRRRVVTAPVKVYWLNYPTKIDQ